jgi:hypothetical protein
VKRKDFKEVTVVKVYIKKEGGTNLQLLALVCLTFLGVVAAIGVTCAFYPQRPEYCSRCHSMRPAYDRWTKTVCREVSCVECHTGGKGAVCLSREIEDSNCMSGRCHTTEKLFAKKEPYKKTLPFSHETHLKEDPPGLKMRCTACHSYQGGEKHFEIDDMACNLCHFIPRKEDVKLTDGGTQEISKCALCHGSVDKKVQIYDKEFDHAAYEKKAGVECMDCHNSETVHGMGTVERRYCYHCHDRVPEDYVSAKEMHYDHMVRHKVSCNPCHQDITHKIYKEDKELEACESCKGLVSEGMSTSGGTQEGLSAEGGLVSELTQWHMMKGEGGRGVDGLPDPMYLATVSCKGCHKSVPGGDKDDERVEPGVCNNCHEKGFEKIYKEQMDLVTEQMEALKKLLEVAKEAGKVEGVEAMEARHNYEFITSDGSFGVHNIKYTRELLELSIRQVREALSS